MSFETSLLITFLGVGWFLTLDICMPESVIGCIWQVVIVACMMYSWITCK